jgi:hypothetical protein
MDILDALSNECRVRHKVQCQRFGEDIALTLEGETLFVSHAPEFGRFAIWGDVAKLRSDEVSAAARLSLAFNDETSYQEAIVLGVSSESQRAILGRSFDCDSLDAGRLIREAREVATHLYAARRWLGERLPGAMSSQSRSPEEDPHAIRV